MNKTPITRTLFDFEKSPPNRADFMAWAQESTAISARQYAVFVLAAAMIALGAANPLGEGFEVIAASVAVTGGIIVLWATNKRVKQNELEKALAMTQWDELPIETLNDLSQAAEESPEAARYLKAVREQGRGIAGGEIFGVIEFAKKKAAQAHLDRSLDYMAATDPGKESEATS